MNRVLAVAAGLTLLAVSAAADINADLQSAVKAGDIERVRTLLDQRADVNSRNAVGAAPIHEAAWAGNVELLDLLLSRGANVNLRHADGGSTALHYAVITNHLEAVATLLRHGADLQAEYRSGAT